MLIYNYTEDKLTWDERATKLLISSYAAKKDQFRNPKLKKKDLWINIKLQFLAKNYRNIICDMLNKKWLT